MTFRLTSFAFVCLMATATVSAASAVIDSCYPVTPLPDLLADLDPHSSQVFIDSDGIELDSNQQASFFGNVQVSYRDTLLQAPTASFNQQEQVILADGGINYYSPALAVRSQKFAANLQENQVELFKADYQLTAQAGRGAADILQASETSLQLNQASFTACPAGDNSWALHANEIKLNADEGWGQAWHTMFKVRDIPVFYLPYLSFPITDARKSGLLLPNVGSSQRLGVDFELPYYFNLAENYDLTLTPRLMTNRGYQLKSEFRYLTQAHRGLLHLEYMHKDREQTELAQRYLGHYSQRSDFNPRWRATLDVTDISDDAYIADLGSDYINQSDTQLLKQGNLTYYGDDVLASLQLQDFTVLGNYDKAYAALPIVDLRSAEPTPLISGIEFAWQAQYAYFSNDQALVHSAHRAHIEPTIRFPFITPAMEFTAETSLMHTRYQQNSNEQHQGNARNIQRTLPKFRLRGQLNFERTLSRQGEIKLQTFEPQLQYLYIPHREQSEIGLFDTTRLQDDYFGLFRENRFSGLDRINEANQLTLGATSRIYDANDREQFRFSLGQIFFITSPTELQDPFQQNLTDIESMLAAESMWQWHRRWFVSAAVQYDSDNRNLIKSNLSFDYRGSDKKLFQLNHRYSQAVSDYEISQIGVLGTQPVADHWQLFGSYYYDLNHSQMMEAHFGIQYESCCWAVRLVARRQIATDLTRNPTDLNIPSTFDNGISLQFVLKGFGDKAGFAVTDMLSNGIFSYRRPYLLNN
jgi:LPS-assembly protein